MNPQMASRLCAILCVAGLAACATATAPAPEPKVKIVEVPTPIRVACIPPGFRDPPAYPTKAELANSPGPGDMLQAVTAAYLLMDQWIKEAAPVLKGCR
jgi:hypothetical protein